MNHVISQSLLSRRQLADASNLRRVGRFVGCFVVIFGVTLLCPVGPNEGAVSAKSGAKSKKKPSATIRIGARQRPQIRRLPPPVLMVRQRHKDVPLKITAAHIEARIVGHLAETSLTLTFYNPNRRAMEGQLYFPLPAGAVVSGYALDIKGVLVDGVVVSRDKGRKVFEAEVRKGVDPGLVEWTRGSNFKTRIYPIPARGSRTVRVRYVADVSQRNGQPVYTLPLAFRDKVKQLSLRIEVVRAAKVPIIAQGGPAGLAFGKWRSSYVAEVKLTNSRLHDDLVIALPDLGVPDLAGSADGVTIRVEQPHHGPAYFSVRHQLPRRLYQPATSEPTTSEKTPPPKRIGLYWDASLSRAKVSHKQELTLLKRYLSGLGDASIGVELVVFRNVAEPVRHFVMPRQRAALLRTLGGMIYDGGTQLGCAQPSSAQPEKIRDHSNAKIIARKVDLNLLFTDGISNFGKEDPRGLKAPTYVINAAATANHAMLRYLALRTGGAVFNLRRIAINEAVARIGKPLLTFVGVKVISGHIGATWPQLPQPVGQHFELAGTLWSDTATVVLQYGYGQRIVYKKSIKIERKQASPGMLLRRYWAQKKIDDLLTFPDRNAEVITAVGRRFSIVTPGTSLIVLERLGQYVQHKIRPPKMLPKMRLAWQAAMDVKARNEKASRQGKLKHILALWKKRVTWWKTRFSRPKKSRFYDFTDQQIDGVVRGAGAGGGGTRHRSSMGRGAEPEAPRTTSSRRVAAGRPMAKKSGAASPAKRRPDATIRMQAWDPKTPYLKAIRAVKAKKQYRVYLQQRAKFGSAPAFFLDCADHFRKQKQPRIALRILSNIAELKLDDAALMRVLAHRLTQIGELDLSIGILRAVQRLRSEDPQSYRDLALVLARRAGMANTKADHKADYKAALNLLAKVVMERWQRFDEIEVIALTEFNHILLKARKIGVKALPLDKRLVQHLDLDIRIVMTWDADLTDMDLHVIEPTGEEAYYGHRHTRIGGLVSRDFTRGYGPEVYVVRRAMQGKYKIRTKYYGSAAAKLTGAVTLQVDVYTNYGRANERRKSVTLRLTERKETFTVAEIGF